VGGGKNGEERGSGGVEMARGSGPENTTEEIVLFEPFFRVQHAS